RRSFLVSDVSMNRHISVIAGTRRTHWTGFTMIGPHDFDGADENRALTIGMGKNLSSAERSNWDASGTWVDDVRTIGVSSGFHLAGSDDVRFGDLETYETGNSRDGPGS